MDYEIREANTADGDAMLALMPRLAEFDIPPSRNAEDLYRDDAALMRRWLDGKEECLVHVAAGENQQVLGFTLVRLRPEPLSHEPSAHLEAIAVDRDAEGRGVARALLDAAEKGAMARGALTMTLHVIATNQRARDFYARRGYDGELIRYIKALS